MTHTEIDELLSAYADDELTPAQREMVELHLAGCVACRQSLAEFRLTRQQLALLADSQAAHWQPDVVGRVTERILQRRRWLGLGRRLASGAVSVLAVGILLIAVAWLLRHVSTIPSGEEALVGVPGAGGSTSTPESTALASTQPTAGGSSTVSSTPMSQLTPYQVLTGTLSSDYMALIAPDASISLYLFRHIARCPCQGLRTQPGL
jgi:anti-sigma factor RsiW